MLTAATITCSASAPPTQSKGVRDQLRSIILLNCRTSILWYTAIDRLPRDGQGTLSRTLTTFSSHRYCPSLFLLQGLTRSLIWLSTSVPSRALRPHSELDPQLENGEGCSPHSTGFSYATSLPPLLRTHSRVWMTRRWPSGLPPTIIKHKRESSRSPTVIQANHHAAICATMPAPHPLSKWLDSQLSPFNRSLPTSYDPARLTLSEQSRCHADTFAPLLGHGVSLHLDTFIGRVGPRRVAEFPDWKFWSRIGVNIQVLRRFRKDARLARQRVDYSYILLILCLVEDLIARILMTGESEGEHSEVCCIMWTAIKSVHGITGRAYLRYLSNC